MNKYSFHFQFLFQSLYAIASPCGIIAGVCILSADVQVIDQVAMAFLTALATGSFVFVTFFEILGKDLQGNDMRDLLNLGMCVVGFTIFAAITALPIMRN